MGAHLVTYAVLCPDRKVRHPTTADLDLALCWAKRPDCCPLGRHRVVRARALQEVA